MTTTGPIRLGFMPLADAAIPIVAARKGFAEREGLVIDLVRETSWANIRDRLAVGHFEAAHLLAPMPVANALGLSPVHMPLTAPMALGQGGNAVTVSGALWRAMSEAEPHLAAGDPRIIGRALRTVLARRNAAGWPPPAFAVVHPFSSHNYELRYWLAASGIAPDTEVEIGVLSPPLMPAALHSGALDGFCVGEPWNTIAAAGGDAVIALAKTDIWRASPEKVLSLRTEWAEQHPETVVRLIAAMLDAAEWCGDPANHAALAALLSSPDLLGVPADMLRPVLATGIAFFGNGATFPWLDHARWFGGQMRRWGQTDAGAEAIDQAAATYRPDLYRMAAARRGLNVPAVDVQPDAPDCAEIPGTLTPLPLVASRLFDR